jgi:hypothetical protein
MRLVNLLIGKAAYETARRLYPTDLIEYRRVGPEWKRPQRLQVPERNLIALNLQLAGVHANNRCRSGTDGQSAGLNEKGGQATPHDASWPPWDAC